MKVCQNLKKHEKVKTICLILTTTPTEKQTLQTTTYDQTYYTNAQSE